MGKGERLRRANPERTGPMRNAATYLRDPAPADGVASGSTVPDPAAPVEDPVAHGVRLGYKVIEEQIRQGRRLAQRLGNAAGKVGAAGPGEGGVLVERVLHLYNDVGALCFDAVETLARSPTLRAGIARASQADAETRSGADAGAGTGFVIEVASTRRTQVTLDLRMRPGRFVPLVHALHAAESAIPPLTGVRFDLTLPEPLLRVEIADAQPAATYTGVVVDSTTNEPRGTVSVRLLP